MSRPRFAALAFAVVAVALFGGLASLRTSQALAPLHGIGFAKGCNTPIVVGQLYTCDVLTINNLDTAGDTLTISSVVDVVYATAGPQTSPNLLPTLTLGFTGGASCGVGQLICTLPAGASIYTTASYGFYITQPGDPNPLTDIVTLTWKDLCTSLALNCPIGNQFASAGSSAVLQTATPTRTPTATPVPPSTAVVGGFSGYADIRSDGSGGPPTLGDTQQNSPARRYLGFAAALLAVVIATSLLARLARRRALA